MSQETSVPNMDAIGLKTKELLTYHYGCHGNLVIIATRYVADAYCPKELHTKYGLITNQDKGVIDTSL